MTDKEIQKSFDSSRNLFLTGPAGTGKTFWLNKYIESHSNVLVVAPTGIAALNLGGDTMHKVFHIPVPAFESPSFAKNKKGAITTAMLKVIAGADTVIVDEISMARNAEFAFMIKVIRKAEKIKGSKIRIIVSGDFSQLPPVVKKTELKLMKKFKFHESGYAFTTPEWKSCNFKVVELTEVKRQDNKDFINILNEIRVGDWTHIDYFKQFVNENPNYDDAICICGTNTEADRINQEYLDGLEGNTTVLQSRKEGRVGNVFNNDLILIKEGARVIFTANDLIKNKYKNGTFGIVKAINADSVTIEIEGKDEVIYRQDYPVYSYGVNGNSLTKKELGVVHQYPFKLGKAITIHKSQGQTFDNVIISPEIFAAGQLYVVLSRVRSPEGMVLLREVAPEHLIIDPIVEKFYKNGYKWVEKRPSSKTTTTKKTTRKPTSKSSTNSKFSKSSGTTKSTAKSTKSKTSKTKSSSKTKTGTNKSKTVTKKSTTKTKRTVKK